ncbi:MAG: hypothetical protein ABF990_05210 [Acetobacter sp.]
MPVIAIIAAAIIAGGAIFSGGAVAYSKADAVYDVTSTHTRVATFLHG